MTKKKSHDSLTRAAPTSNAEVAKQVREAATLMGRGAWIVAVTEIQMAKKWGCTVEVVRNRAAEARRLVGVAFGDLKELKAVVLAQLEGIASEQRYEDPKTAVTALLGLANIAGLITHKIEAKTDVSRLTETEALELLAQARDRATKLLLEKA